MSRKSPRRKPVPQMDMMRIAVSTGVSLRTVQRYYSGAKVNASTLATIERACFELSIGTRADAA